MTRLGARSLGWSAALALVIAACSAPAAWTGPPPTAPPGGVLIVAQALAFDRTRLAVPAGVPFEFLVASYDAAPHNVTILDDGGRPVFVGETFGGPGSRTYSVPPIAAGRYRFRCDVHTYMTGTVDASPSVAQ